MVEALRAAAAPSAFLFVFSQAKPLYSLTLEAGEGY
jgi:hypothetical protein